MTGRRYTRGEVVELLEVTEDFLLVLEREAIVAPDPAGNFAPTCLERIRVCRSLHDDLGVNLAGVEVALALMERIGRERRQFHEVLTWLRGELTARDRGR